VEVFHEFLRRHISFHVLRLGESLFLSIRMYFFEYWSLLKTCGVFYFFFCYQRPPSPSPRACKVSGRVNSMEDHDDEVGVALPCLFSGDRGLENFARRSWLCINSLCNEVSTPTVFRSFSP
jgi:hypothetical protein